MQTKFWLFRITLRQKQLFLNLNSCQHWQQEHQERQRVVKRGTAGQGEAREQLASWQPAQTRSVCRLAKFAHCLCLFVFGKRCQTMRSKQGDAKHARKTIAEQPHVIQVCPGNDWINARTVLAPVNAFQTCTSPHTHKHTQQHTYTHVFVLVCCLTFCAACDLSHSLEPGKQHIVGPRRMPQSRLQLQLCNLLLLQLGNSASAAASGQLR